MRRASILILFAGLAIIIVGSGFEAIFPYGIAGKTGSPGETTCTDCHTSFPIDDGTGSVTISSPDLIGWQYDVGQTYTINVTVARTGNPLFGFDCECLDTANHDAGALIVMNSETQLLNATINSLVRKNMTHTINGGLTTDSHTFSFNWTAPPTNIGDVKFWVTGNATNANNAPAGDHIYSTSQIVTPSLGTGIVASNEIRTSLSVFPNPAQDDFTLSFCALHGEEINVQLISIEGKSIELIHHQIAEGNQQSIPIHLPTNLKEGIYLIRLVHGPNTVTQKIIVQ